MSDNPLEGLAKTIFDEAMDEINEEFIQALETIITAEKLKNIIKETQNSTKTGFIETIQEHFNPEMSDVQKMILGEKLSRVTSKVAKKQLLALISEITKKSLDLVDELRNEVIGEVFEETE